MVLVGVYSCFIRGLAPFSVPYQLTAVYIVDDISQLPHFRLEGFNAVSLLNLQGGESVEVEMYTQQGATDDKGLGQVGRIDEVVF